MKTYTHPTITLPAGAVVVKFYDDSKTGTETTPNIIESIGDVEEGFDISLGELRVPTLDLKLRDAANYVTGTLLDTNTLSYSVTVNNEYYFFGDVDFESIDPDVFEYSSTVKQGEVTLPAIHVFARLSSMTMDDIRLALASITDPITNYIYLRQFFRLFAINCGLTFAAFTDITFTTQRKFGYYDTTDSAYVDCYFDKVMINTTHVGNAGTESLWENSYMGRINNAFELLGELAREFFFYPSIVYDGTNFKLKILERDDRFVVLLGDVLISKPYKKYSLRSLKTICANTPLTADETDFIFKDGPTGNALGEDYLNELHCTNIVMVDGILTSMGGTLSTTEMDITYTGNSETGKSGTALITHGAATQSFSYRAKVAGTYIGCKLDSGTFVFTSGDTISNAETFWLSNMRLYVKNKYAAGSEEITRVSNYNFGTSAYVNYTSYNEAMHEAVKGLYYTNNNWRNLKVHTLTAEYSYNKKLQYLMPGYYFSHFSETHFIHTVKKSLMRNESELLCLVTS